MDYVSLGTTGLKVSRLCLGTMTYGSPDWRPWVLDEVQGRPFIKQALEAGITFFDSADMYSLGKSEEVLGRALRDFGPGRDKVVIATKLYNPMSADPNDRGLSRKHIRHAVEASLRRLGTDYIDLYQIHRFDSETPIEETLCALDELVRSGKVLYLGASSMAAWQFSRMLHTAGERGWSRFVTMQNHYNLLYREEEREMIPLCLHEGIGLIPWSPLARGLLAGSREQKTVRSTSDAYMADLYSGSDPAVDDAIVKAVASVAQARGLPPAQVALSWLSHKPGVVAPIIGASKAHHLTDAVASLSLTLTPQEIQTLEAPYRPRPVAGHR